MKEPSHPVFLVCRGLLRIFFRAYNRWEVVGRDHVPSEGGVLLIANHTSYADPPLVGSACNRPVHFMAKSELFGIPVLGWIIRRTHAFPVRRGSGDREALRRAVRYMRERKVLLVFPEGTRSPNGRLQTAEHGAAFIALMSGAKVVPVAVTGGDHLLPLHSPIVRPAKVRVEFGQPVDLGEPPARVTREALQQASDTMMAALRALLPPERR